MKPFRFSVAIDGPFDFRLTVRKPAGWHWATPFEAFENGTLYTAVRLGKKLVGLKLNEKEGKVNVSAFSVALSAAEKRELAAMVRMGLGADEDIKGFYSLGKKDALVRCVKKDLYGMRVGFPVGVFERALLAICLQMTRMDRANEMMRCLIRRYGGRMKFEGREILYWPAPEDIAKTAEKELRAACKLGYRAKAIRRVARSIANGFPGILSLASMPEEEAMKKLTDLYGIGEYSAQIISPHAGFPLDVWSARIFHEILFGSTPKEPRKSINKVEKEAMKRWGRYAWHAFVYVLHDLPNLSKRYGINIFGLKPEVFSHEFRIA